MYSTLLIFLNAHCWSMFLITCQKIVPCSIVFLSWPVLDLMQILYVHTEVDLSGRSTNGFIISNSLFKSINQYEFNRIFHCDNFCKNVRFVTFIRDPKVPETTLSLFVIDFIINYVIWSEQNSNDLNEIKVSEQNIKWRYKKLTFKSFQWFFYS